MNCTPALRVLRVAEVDLDLVGVLVRERGLELLVAEVDGAVLDVPVGLDLAGVLPVSGLAHHDVERRLRSGSSLSLDTSMVNTG